MRPGAALGTEGTGLVAACMALGQAAGAARWPHILPPTYAHSQPEGRQDTLSPYGCMAMDKWPPLSEPHEQQRLLFPRPDVWGRNPTCLEHLLGACPRVT